MSQTPPGAFQRFESFVREYTAGLDGRGMRRLFDQDATAAFDVLTREHRGSQPEPADGFKRFLYRTKIVFLGLSYKLSPPRRLLFAVSLIALLLAVFGDAGFSRAISQGGVTRTFTVSASPFWTLLSVGGLVFLLALELVDRIRVRDELEVARELQEDLLPQTLPIVPGYTFAHFYRTAKEVGGDYHDVAILPDGRVDLTIGDASGHGMAAGLVMAIANATLKAAMDLDPSPERVLALLNRTLCRTGTKRTFMSVFYAVLTPETGQLEYVCAGHPFPLIRRVDGTLEELGCGGFPLGLREPLAVEPRTAKLQPGDLLLLYTDGLAEAVDATGKEAFGYERIRAVLELGGSPQSVHEGMLRAFDRHTAGEPLRDDLTLLVIARLPPLPVM
jgi:sigma-B regulation protein RsbU (phosphoserine phosphatase)